MAKYTEAQAKAVKKYLASMSEIKLRMLPPFKEHILQAAQNSGKSMQAYILDAVNAQIKIDEDGVEIPPEFITGLIDWLKLHGHTDTEIIDCLSALGVEK